MQVKIFSGRAACVEKETNKWLKDNEKKVQVERVLHSSSSDSDLNCVVVLAIFYSVMEKAPSQGPYRDPPEKDLPDEDLKEGEFLDF